MFMKVSVPQNGQLNLGTLHINPKHSVKKALAIAFCLLLIQLLSFSLNAQNTVRVRGRVVSETGQPVPKVSVLVKGTSNGVTGNDNGDFEINAPATRTMVISSVGYGTKEVVVQQAVAVTLT